MITRGAIRLAIALGASTALIAATAQHDIALDPSYGINGIKERPGSNPDMLRLSAQSAAGAQVSAPITVAQGRCFNGRCY